LALIEGDFDALKALSICRSKKQWENRSFGPPRRTQVAVEFNVKNKNKNVGWALCDEPVESCRSPVFSLTPQA
jgi:hypothetical protein